MDKKEKISRSVKAGIGLAFTLPGFIMVTSYLLSFHDTTAFLEPATSSEFVHMFTSILGSALVVTSCMTPVILAATIGTYTRIGFAEKITNKLSKYQIIQK